MTMTNPSKNTNIRLKQLDILRAIAILLVIGRHKFVSNFWYLVGWTGVELFFVMSSFLTSGLLFSEYKKSGKIDFKNFLIRRSLRIYPAFYVFISVTIIYNYLVDKKVDFISVASEIFFFQNYAPHLWKHTWYLAVDQHFYVILLPLCLIFLMKTGKSKSDPFQPIVKIFIVIAISMNILRILANIYIPYEHTTHFQVTHLRLDSLAFGVLLAYLYNFHTDKFSQFIRSRFYQLLLLGIILISPCMLLDLKESNFIHTIGITLIYLGVGCLLLCLIYWDGHLPRQIDRILSPVSNVLIVIGLNSYSIYLWHLPVAKWGITLIKRVYPYQIHYVVEFWIYLVGSIALGIIMNKLIEEPVMELRKKLYPSPSTITIKNKEG